MTSPATIRRYLSPADVSETLDVDLRKILAWIKTGELRALNLATRANGGKPRWRIAQVDLETFLERRSSAPAPAPPRRRRKDPNVTEYF